MEQLTWLRNKGTEIFFWIVAFFLFIGIGFYLGVMPGTLPVMETSVFAGHGMDAFANSGFFDLTNRSTFYPFGGDGTEGFTIMLLFKPVYFFWRDSVGALSVVFFLLYGCGFAALLFTLRRLAKSKVATLIMVLLYYLFPLIPSQVVPVYFGIIFLPVCLWLDVLLLDFVQKENPKRKPMVWAVSFLLLTLCRLTFVGIGWYTAVIGAVMSCGVIGLYSLLSIKRDTIWRTIGRYAAAVLLPWIVAMGIVMAQTAEGSGGLVKGMDFFAGNSVDLLTTVLPSWSQWISKFIPTVFQFVPEGWNLAGDGTMFSNYMGIIIILGAIGAICCKKTRSKKSIAFFCVAVITLALSMGPAFRILGVTQETDWHMYLLPIDEMVKTPWSFLYHIFPLRSMRATYRWIIAARTLLLLLSAQFFGYFLTQERKVLKGVGVLLLCVSVIEFYPSNLSYSLQHGKGAYEMAQTAKEDMTKQLEELVEPGSLVMLCSYDGDMNAFLSPIIATQLKVKTYIGSGDKAKDLAAPYIPALIRQTQVTADPQMLSQEITLIAQQNLCDYVILPYFDLRACAAVWPADENWRNHTMEIAAQVESNLGEQYPIYKTDYYMVVKCSAYNDGYILSKDENAGLITRKDQDFAEKTTYIISPKSTLQATINNSRHVDTCYFQLTAKSEKQAGAVTLVVRKKDAAGSVISENAYSCELSRKYALLEYSIDALTDCESLEIILTSEEEVKVKECRLQLYSVNDIYDAEG